MHANSSERPGLTVSDISETQLLAQVFPLLAPAAAAVLGPGDDAAVLAAPDRRVVVSTDVLVEGHHFRRDWSTGYDVGWRAAMQNMADVAAMGASPTALVVALVLPDDVEVRWVCDLARGLSDAGMPWGAGVVGGDLSGGAAVTVAVTVHGSLEGRTPVLRSGAQPGDVVAHAGVRGRSAAGLAVLAAGDAPPEVDARGAAIAHELDTVRGAFRRPVAAIDAGVAAAAAGAHALIDVSDGLLRDARRVAVASDVTIALDEPLESFADEVELLAPVARLLGGGPALVRSWVLTGGEDHGMLAVFPAGATLPVDFRTIGTVVPRGTDDVLVAGAPAARGGGWDHFGGTTTD